MALLGQFLYQAIEIYTFVIIASVVVSWLITFNVISMDHPAAKNLVSILGRLTDPVMRPVQKYVPSIGGIDISPIVVLFALMFLQNIIVRLIIGSTVI